MSDLLNKGDRVHFTPRYVACMGYKGHKSPIDWSKREGTVLRANDAHVAVQWDGRRTADDCIPRSLERVP